MQEIVNKVLEVEKAAEQRIQEARSKAAEIRAKADKDVQAKLEEAREEAARRSQEILAQASNQATAEHDKALQQTQEENQLFFENHEEQIDEAAQTVVRMIIAPQWS
jgi:V/A-type H+-transporting ATPase subunit G/H